MKLKDKQKLIEKIRTKAPAIFNVVVSEMGYEFDAISSSGFIERRVGMLLNAETGGHLPDFLETKAMPDFIRNEKLEQFFKDNLEVIPYEELDAVILLTIADKIYAEK